MPVVMVSYLRIVLHEGPASWFAMRFMFPFSFVFTSVSPDEKGVGAVFYFRVSFSFPLTTTAFGARHSYWRSHSVIDPGIKSAELWHKLILYACVYLLGLDLKILCVRPGDPSTFRQLHRLGCGCHGGCEMMMMNGRQGLKNLFCSRNYTHITLRLTTTPCIYHGYT